MDDPRQPELEWARCKLRPVSLNGHSPVLALFDLFCGCGGLTLGVWEAARGAGLRLDVRYALDWSARAIEVYRANFNCSDDVVVNESVANIFADVGDAVTRAEGDIKKKVGHVDLIVAGPPCQGHSDLNNSSRRQDPRNGLYLKVVRAAEVLAPRIVFIENVPTVIHDSDAVIDKAVSSLREIGYHVDHAIVSMLKVGVPQRRKRHLLVASRRAFFDIREFVDELPDSTLTAGEFLAGLEDEPSERPDRFYQPSRPTAENAARIAYLFKKKKFDLPNELRPSCHRDKEHAYVSMYGRMHWDRPAQTLTSGFGSMGQGRYVHPTRPRLITPHEAARLQGFPDFFDFSCVDSVTALREMIANAVPPPLSRAFVAEFIRRKLV